MSRKGMEIIGQRGAGGHAPACTEPSVLAAAKSGATAVELEIQFTADAAPMVFSDRTLERQAGVKGTIRNQTRSELGGYDVGFRFGDRFRGLRLLSLEEALDLVPPGMGIHIDIKDHDTVNAKHLRGLVGLLKRQQAPERFLLLSRSEEILASLGSADRDFRHGLKLSAPTKDAVERAAALGCGSLHPDAGATRKEIVASCHEKGLKVFPHGANETRAIRSLVDLGVDGLATDQPQKVAEAGSARGSEGARRAPAHAATPPASPASAEEPPREAARRPRRRRRRSSAAAREASAPATDTSRRVGIQSEGESLPSPPKSAAAGSADAEPPLPEPVAAQEPSAGEATATPDTPRQRRRRGRRGGKREQERRARLARAATAPQAEDSAEPIPLEPIEEDGEPLELLGEIHAELFGEVETPPPGGEAPPKPEGASRKRRRGRRGGKRIQARRKRSRQTGGGEGV